VGLIDVRLLCSDVSHMPLLSVWRDSGIAERHGIRLEVDVCGISTAGGVLLRKSMRAPLLLDGSYQLVSGLHREPYLYRSRGDKRLGYIAQTQNDWDDRLVVAPGISDVRGLEGRVIAVTSGAPCVVGNLQQALIAAGADPGRVRLDLLEGDGRDTGQRALQAVLDGRADGAVVDLPFDRIAARGGLGVLALPQVPVIHNVTICVDLTWADAHRELVLSILRSLIETVHFFKTRPAATRTILEATMGPLIGIDDPADIAYLQESWAALLERKPYPHPSAIWNVFHLDLDATELGVAPLEPWDTSFLRAIDEEGFIDALWPKGGTSGRIG
jgi:hypothetical protein